MEQAVGQVLVVGPGRVGKCLALVHQRAGAEVFLLGRQQGLWMEWARAHQMEPLLDWPAQSHSNLLVLLAVSDRELVSVIADCQLHCRGSDKTVIHVSGSLGAESFHPFGDGFAKCAAIHPLMAFSGDPETDANTLALSMATIALALGQPQDFDSIFSAWGARAVPLARNTDRVRYHLGLSLLSNHVTALCGWAFELLQPALGQETTCVVTEMAERAVRACVADGADVALTGPVVRGDVLTVQAHLDSLEPQQAARYRGALLAVVDLAQASGRLADSVAAEFRALCATETS